MWLAISQEILIFFNYFIHLHNMNNFTENELSYKIIGCAIEVHKHLGPGLLESAYRECLFYELKLLGLIVEQEKIFTYYL